MRQHLILLGLVAIILLFSAGCHSTPALLRAPSAVSPYPLPAITFTEMRGINYVRTTRDNPDICPDLHYDKDPDCPWDMDIINADLDRLQAQGVNTIRIFLNYYIFGAARLTNPDYNMDLALQHLDDLIDAANQRGIYVMPTLLSKYPQYRFGPDAYDTALDMHVRPVVRHLANHPGVIAWDIFNEPDIGSPIDVRCWDWDNADFAFCFPMANERLHFLRAMRDEIKQLDPETPVTISMAFAKSYFEPEGTDLSAAELVDFFAFHYYDNDPYDSGRYAAHWYYGEGFPADLERSIDELHALDPTKPVVLTEIGFPSGPGTQRTAAAMRRDLDIAYRVAHQQRSVGILLWPFLNHPETDIDQLFQP